MYKKYGDCFKKLRNQKNLGLSYFSKLEKTVQIYLDLNMENV